MVRKLRAPLLAMLLLAAAAQAGAAQEEGGGTRSTNEGVYTESQAQRGLDHFSYVCVECHIPGDFTDVNWDGVWTGQSIYRLYDQMWSTMPEDNPGGLEPQVYVDVIAYILQLNGYPTGDEELPVGQEGLEKIVVDVRPEASGPERRR